MGSFFASGLIRHLIVSLMAASIVATSIGCQRSTLARVYGAVVVDGRPVADGVIGFWPDDGGGGTVQARIVNGRYVARLAAGSKRVSVEAFEDGGWQSVMGPGGTVVRVRRNILDTALADPKTSSLRCVVDPSATRHDFQIVGTRRD